MVDVVCGVAAGDDCAGAGDFADAVAEVVGGPDVAALIDGEAVGAVQQETRRDWVPSEEMRVMMSSS